MGTCLFAQICTLVGELECSYHISHMHAQVLIPLPYIFIGVFVWVCVGVRVCMSVCVLCARE